MSFPVRVPTRPEVRIILANFRFTVNPIFRLYSFRGRIGNDAVAAGFHKNMEKSGKKITKIKIVS